MPKRSNLFQTLVHALHEQIAYPHRVVESEMLIDMTSGKQREVDVVIRSDIGGYDFVLSIECTDRDRPVSVEWVEQMCCKHRDLPTHKLVLISKSGFSEAAVAKATKHGAETLTFESAREVNWTLYVHRLSKVFIAAIDTVTVIMPRSKTFQISSPYSGVPMATIFMDPEGRFQATTSEIVHATLNKEPILWATLGKMDTSEGKGWEIILPLKDGVRMKMPNGAMHDVDELRIALLANPVSAMLKLEKASFKNSHIAYGEARIPSGQLLLTIVESDGKPTSARLKVIHPWGERETYVLEGEGPASLSPASDETMRALLGKRQS